ncbi:MAG: T9SS type A sorting domain-containing protein [Chitinophagales bacterium]|nr:T9SS type A sorting domain-containing protein [Chitinophagales bacterium]
MKKRSRSVMMLLLMALLMTSVSALHGQNCLPPLKQVVLFDQSGNYYVYWKPATANPLINYKVQVMCIGSPACLYTTTVTDANVLRMNGGYLGTKIPPLPILSNTVKLSIFAPSCPEQFTLAFVLSLDIITDNLDIATASCDSDTCKLVVDKWTKLKKLTDYANSKCGTGGTGLAASTVTAINAPIDILLRKTAAGKWQIKSLDTLKCDSCYVFNFQVTCSSGSVYYVQDTICFNYTGPDIGCRETVGNTAGWGTTVFPNPASAECTIRIACEDEVAATVSLYNAMGGLIRIVANDESLEEGLNDLSFSVADLASGMYIIELRMNNEVKRMKLLKF